MIKPVDGWDDEDVNDGRQTTNNVNTLIRHAEQARATFKRYVMALAEEVGLHDEINVNMGPIKNLERIFEKAAGRKEGRFDDICDICRGQLMIDSPEDVKAIRKLLRPGRKSTGFNKTWENRDIRIESYDDYFAKPTKTGFRGMNITLEIGGIGKGRKHYVELQIVHRDMKEALATTHMLYSQKRELEESAEACGQELTEDQKAVVDYYMDEAKRIHEAESERLGLYILEDGYDRRTDTRPGAQRGRYGFPYDQSKRFDF